MRGLNSTQWEHAGIPVNNQQHFFFMLTGAGLGAVKIKSMEPLSDPHVLVGKSALSQLARPNDWCQSFEKRERFLCRGLELGGRVWLSVWASKSWASLETTTIVEMCTTPVKHISFTLKVYGIFSAIFSYVMFCSRKGSLKIRPVFI